MKPSESFSTPRLEAFRRVLVRRRLDLALIVDVADLRSLTGLECDNAVLALDREGATFYTDFRYLPMVRRLAGTLRAVDLGRFTRLASRRRMRIGYESRMPHSQYLRFSKLFPHAVFVDLTDDLQELRAVKEPQEIDAIRAAVRLNDRIWRRATRRFAAGMTEREMARIIRRMMIDEGDGEAFDTIVCVGRNAAECHHRPDDTRWDGRESVLVDMGVRLNGWCSDMTRCLKGRRPSARYREVYDLVRAANRAAIAAVRPGVTGKALDAVARQMLAAHGYGAAFGHSLGHGVGLEIHEAPYASKSSRWTLRSGMLVTIEPGVYLEGELGVRLEDLVLVTDDGCEVLTRSPM